MTFLRAYLAHLAWTLGYVRYCDRCDVITRWPRHHQCRCWVWLG